MGGAKKKRSRTTCPDAPLLPLGFGLGRCVAAFAILGPVERKSVSYEPASDMRPTNCADRDRALVSFAIYLDAFDVALQDRTGNTLAADAADHPVELRVL